MSTAGISPMPTPKAPRRSAARSFPSLIGAPISSPFPVGSRSRWLRRLILLESAVSIKRRGASAHQQEGRDTLVAGVLGGCGTLQGSRATRYNSPRLRRSWRRLRGEPIHHATRATKGVALTQAASASATTPRVPLCAEINRAAPPIHTQMCSTREVADERLL